MHLVVLAYTALMRHLKHDRALQWAHTRLMTIGESYRTIVREVLGKTLAWAIQRSHQGLTLPQIKQLLALP
jgi:hypothetical protein